MKVNVFVSTEINEVHHGELMSCGVINAMRALGGLDTSSEEAINSHLAGAMMSSPEVHSLPRGNVTTISIRIPDLDPGLTVCYLAVPDDDRAEDRMSEFTFMMSASIAHHQGWEKAPVEVVAATLSCGSVAFQTLTLFAPSTKDVRATREEIEAWMKECAERINKEWTLDNRKPNAIH